MEARVLNYGDIGWAVNHLRVDHEVRRKDWPTTFLRMRDSHIWLCVSDDDPGIPYQATMTDLLAGDWALRNPTLPGEYHAP